MQRRKRELVYFLNLLKDDLGFENADDFKNKIKSEFDFRFKIQKFVFLAKYFGWNNSYKYNLYRNGPYAPVLTEDYYSEDIFGFDSYNIDNFNLSSFKEFIKDKDKYYLEAASTILLYKKFIPNFTVDDAILKLSQIKPYISCQIVKNAFFDVDGLNLSKKQISNNANSEILNDIKNNLNSKISYNIERFENFDINYNRVLILGSLDYLRIVLREENLNDYLKNDLFDIISDYIVDVDKIYSICNGNEELFENMSLNTLEEFFDRIQDYISHELDIIPRLDDDNFDESLFY